MAKRARTKAPQADVVEVVERLEAKYGKPRLIPRFDPIEELVSCILSQHTTDASSFPAFTKLRETFPDWQTVVDAGPERVAQVVWGAGLANQKGRSIVRALAAIKELTGDYSLEALRGMSMLEARAWLLALPGVGPKTASIVLCFCFGMPAIPVDTHVYRVAWRLGFVPEGVGEPKAHDLLLAIVPPEYAFRFHVSLIQHGRHTCRAPLPDCDTCPLTDVCPYFQSGGPAKRKAELSSARRRKTA